MITVMQTTRFTTLMERNCLEQELRWNMLGVLAVKVVGGMEIEDEPCGWISMDHQQELSIG